MMEAFASEGWTVGFRTGPDYLSQPYDEEILERLTEALKRHGAHGVTSGWDGEDGTGVTVGFTIERGAHDSRWIGSVFSTAVEMLTNACEDAGDEPLMGAWRAADIEPLAFTIERQMNAGVTAEQLADELLGASEVAQVLEVARQRVYELMRIYEDFPRPVVELSRGWMWSRSEVAAWGKQWERKPGRPWHRERGQAVTSGEGVIQVAAKKSSGSGRGRSAITGRYVKKSSVQRNPKTTVTERSSKKRKG